MSDMGVAPVEVAALRIDSRRRGAPVEVAALRIDSRRRGSNTLSGIFGTMADKMVCGGSYMRLIAF